MEGSGQEILSFTKLNEGTAVVGSGVVKKFSILGFTKLNEGTTVVGSGEGQEIVTGSRTLTKIMFAPMSGENVHFFSCSISLHLAKKLKCSFRSSCRQKLWIRDILVQIWIRGSRPLANGSGSVFSS